MNKPEFRFHEFRAEGDTVSGPLMVYGNEARFGDWRERFQPGSIKVGDDVIANLQHDRAKPVARTGAGLDLQDDPAALRATIRFPETTYAREARELVSANIIRGFSIEFRAVNEEWDGKTRIIREAQLLGFGLVDRPAYSASVIADRFAHTVADLETKMASQRRRYWY